MTHTAESKFPDFYPETQCIAARRCAWPSTSTKAPHLVMSVPEEDFLRLEGAQHELKKRAGRAVDAYATTAVEPEHALLWLTGLRRILPGLKQ